MQLYMSKTPKIYTLPILVIIVIGFVNCYIDDLTIAIKVVLILGVLIILSLHLYN